MSKIFLTLLIEHHQWCYIPKGAQGEIEKYGNDSIVLLLRGHDVGPKHIGQNVLPEIVHRKKDGYLGKTMID